MPAAMTYASVFAVLAVAVVLVLGLRSLLTGSSANTSQLLMRWRVGLQFIAIIVLMLAVYLLRH
jgi:Hypoxia induced protein conserved region